METVTKDAPEKSLKDRLIASLHQDEFVLYVQAILPANPAADQRPFQEIFIRFKEEDAKLLPPGSFLHILEECDLMSYLDRWVVNRLARWVRTALQVKPDWAVPRSNVNLSSQALTDVGFSGYVRQYVERSFLSNGALGLEISWDHAKAHAEVLRRLMAELRPHHCTFTFAEFDATDDGFDLLKTFAPHFIKMSSAGMDPTLLPDIVRRCHQIECKTVIEHVESPEVLAHLRRVKVDFVQGFQVAPVSPL
jgi:EAL domain-containing protein (putative c-di-GMP-specific phosphodiesterase class I)